MTVEWPPHYAGDLNPIKRFWSAAKGEPMANGTPDVLSEIEHKWHAYREKVADNQGILDGFVAASGLFQGKDGRSLV